MNNRNKIKLALIAFIAIFTFSGCGGGGSASFKNTTLGIAVASCSGAISTWTTVNSGDVVSATSGSQIKFDHDSSNNKKVCVVSGTATIQ